MGTGERIFKELTAPISYHWPSEGANLSLLCPLGFPPGLFAETCILDFKNTEPRLSVKVYVVTVKM